MSDKFDHIIRDHVDAHEYDLDPQEIWEGIRQKEKKKKRGFWVWPFGGLGVMLIVFALFTIVSEPTEEQALSMDMPKLNTNRVEVTSSKESFATSEKVVASVSSSTQQPTTAEHTDTRLSNNKLKQPQTSKITLLEENQDFNHSKISIPASFVKKTDLQSRTEKISRKKIQIDVPTIDEMVPMANLSTKVIDLPYGQNSKQDLTNANYTELIQPVTQSKCSFTLTSGYSFMDRQLSSSSVENETLELILNSEQATFTLNNEFLVHYSLSNNFKLSSGLAYQKVVTLFDWNGVLLTDSDGGILSVYDETVGLPSSFTNLYYESIDRTIKHYNQSYFVDVPVNVAYAFTQWKLRPTVSIGAAFNVYNSNNGFRLNKEGVPVSLDDLTGAMKIGTRYSAALALDYPISSAFSAYGTVGGSTRKIDQQDLTTRYRWIDFNIGLKYRL